MRYKVLVVDDDSTLLRFMGEFLGNQNFEVLTAQNGPIALRTAFNEHPDLVVLDVMMPGMDGWEVTSRLREMSNIPIILLTAKNSEADKLRGFRLGVDDYMTKPFSFAELTARIQAVLSRAAPQTNNTRNIILFGDIVLDTDKREAHREGHQIPLTPTEYRMLEVLAHHQNKAVSEEELMQEVWGSYRQEETTAVRRYVWLLRQKIEADPEHPKLVLTVRGFGYRLGTGSLKLPDNLK
ncbi:MAG: response regulator transcription factor [Anaerolineaceae bacterium]|nr:response regulator transcription factor [Anaerolineaceae bacterium]